MYRYKVSIVKVVDGDTVDVDIDLGFGMSYKKQRVRMLGIDTPESRTRDLVEKKFGKASKKHLKNLLEYPFDIELVSHDIPNSDYSIKGLPSCSIAFILNLKF